MVAYRVLPSLRYDLLVSQEARQVECHARDADNRWSTTVAENSGMLEIVCDGLKANFSLDDIYEDVRL